MKKSNSRIGKNIIRSAEANLRLEGMSVPDAVKQDGRDMLDGNVTAEELVAKYIARAKKRESPGGEK